MRVKELIEMLKESNPTDRVVIGIHEESYMGAKKGVNIAHLYNGFDWDKGVTFIVGNLDLTIKKKNSKEKNECK